MNITITFHKGCGTLLGFEDDTHTFPDAEYELTGNFVIVGYRWHRDVIDLSNVKRISYTNQQRPQTFVPGSAMMGLEWNMPDCGNTDPRVRCRQMICKSCQHKDRVNVEV